jgi:hypothetical protein
MEESLRNALSELKRAEHSLFVSLKYTRTVDVIKHIIERLIATIDYSIEVLLRHAKSQRRIAEVPTISRLRIEAVKALYPEDEMIHDFCQFYLKLRRMDKAKYEKSQEYRRHVTMTVHLDEGTEHVTIDMIQDFFEKTKEFVNHVKELIQSETND